MDPSDVEPQTPSQHEPEPFADADLSIEAASDPTLEHPVEPSIELLEPVEPAPPARQSAVFSQAEDFVAEWASTNPMAAHRAGLEVAAGLPPFSPVWWEGQVEHRRRALASITAADPVDDIDRRAAQFMAGDLEAKLALDGLGLRPQVAWLHQIVAASRLADAESESDLADQVTEALAGLRDSLRASASSPLRWTVPEVEAGLAILDRAATESSLVVVREAMAETADDLDRNHAPSAPAVRPFDPDRLAIEARMKLGDDLDLAEALAWTTETLQREDALLMAACQAVDPGASGPADALDHIRGAPDAMVDGADAMQRWLRDLMIQTTEALDGVVLDVPARHRLEVVLTPPNADPAGYDRPSRDGTRRGRLRLAIAGGRRYWPGGYATVAHHQGVPGHHVQIAGLAANLDLSAYQQVFGIAAHTEGWAVYAERLMIELGHHDSPQHLFAHRHEQVKRVALAVADLGTHVEGWNTPKATAVLHTLGFGAAAATRELRRIVNRPFHRAAYILGLRSWRDARSRCGGDLLGFHRTALSLGPVGVAGLPAACSELLQGPR